MKINVQIILSFLLLGYSLLLIYWMILGFGRGMHSSYMYNLVPFSTINLYMKNPLSYIGIINLLGNIGVFIPFGILIPLVFGGRYIKVIVIFLSALFVLESLQLITKRGSFDIDDFILNTIGFTVGYGIYIGPVVGKKLRKNKNRQVQ